MDSFDITFYFLFAVVTGTFLFKFIKHGGLKAAIFGAAINRTVGEIGVKEGMVNIAIKVHTLGSDEPDKAVGLELVAKTIARLRMTSVTLSVSDAKMLASFLQAAAEEHLPHNKPPS